MTSDTAASSSSMTTSAGVAPKTHAKTPGPTALDRITERALDRAAVGARFDIADRAEHEGPGSVLGPDTHGEDDGHETVHQRSRRLDIGGRIGRDDDGLSIRDSIEL